MLEPYKCKMRAPRKNVTFGYRARPISLSRVKWTAVNIYFTREVTGGKLRYVRRCATANENFIQSAAKFAIIPNHARINTCCAVRKRMLGINGKHQARRRKRKGKKNMSMLRSWEFRSRRRNYLFGSYGRWSCVQRALRISRSSKSIGPTRDTNKKGRTEMQEIHWLIVRIHPFSKSSGQLQPSFKRKRIESGLGAVRACSPFIHDASFIHEKL